MRRNMVILCVTVLLFLLGSYPVLAQEFDPKKTGSISVTLTEQQDKEPVVGAELSVYHVASVRMNPNGKLGYVCTETFENAGLDLNDPALATKLDALVLEQPAPAIKMTTDEKGTACCADLALGLYFVKQTGLAEGFAPCTPFLVTVPGAQEDGYVYEVNATPKTEVERRVAITIKKVWNTDESTEVADYVTVQLWCGDDLVKTAILNAQNNWQITYTDLPKSDAYSVKEIDVPKGFTATYSQNGYVFTVTNSSTLIQTGQLVWPIPVLAVVGMLLLVVGFVLLKKKRQSHA